MSAEFREYKTNDFFFGEVFLFPICFSHRFVKCSMRDREWSKEKIVIGVVHLGDSGVRILSASIEHRLGCVLDFLAVLFSVWSAEIRPDEVVVDHPARVSVVAFEPTGHPTHPDIVELGLQNTEVVQACVRDELHKVAAENFRTHESDGDVPAAFG